MQQSAMSALRRLASTRLTIIGLVTLSMGVLLDYAWPPSGSTIVELALATLAVNLLGALATNRRLNRSHALACFHVCLAAVVVLALWGQLTAFQGRVELAGGQAFEATLVEPAQEGRWHDAERLADVDFRQLDLAVEYGAPHARRRITSRVLVDGAPMTIDDMTPLEVAGYRFYPTSNKGFTLMFTWSPTHAPAITGVVNLPSYPLNEWNQRNTLMLPDEGAVTVHFEPDGRVPSSGPWRFDRANATGAVTIFAAGNEFSMRPDDVIQLTNGRLRFEHVGMWMGYAIYRDESLPWLFAIAALGVLSLAWHVLSRLDLGRMRRAIVELPHA